VLEQQRRHFTAPEGAVRVDTGNPLDDARLAALVQRLKERSA
jgi:hypothetical protein